MLYARSTLNTGKRRLSVWIMTYLASTCQMLRDGNHVSGLLGLAKGLLSLKSSWLAIV